MKTTIELPDSLAAEAKRVALAEQTTLRELMISALRFELDRRTQIGPVDFVFPTVGGNGIRVDLDPAEIISFSYGLPK
jgi:hypothetical protein